MKIKNGYVVLTPGQVKKYLEEWAKERAAKANNDIDGARFLRGFRARPPLRPFRWLIFFSDDG